MVNIHTIRLNISDFLKDAVHMDARELGAYISLYIAHIQAGEDGLTLDPNRLARMARVTPKVWKGISTTVLSGFHIVPHPSGKFEGRLVSESCLKVIREAEHISAQNSANALKRKDRSHAGVVQSFNPRLARQR